MPYEPTIPTASKNKRNTCGGILKKGRMGSLFVGFNSYDFFCVSLSGAVKAEVEMCFSSVAVLLTFFVCALSVNSKSHRISALH
jgi:hypothetical protein